MNFLPDSSAEARAHLDATPTHRTGVATACLLIRGGTYEPPRPEVWIKQRRKARDPSTWEKFDTPGGWVERGETILAAMLRELWEEARISPPDPRVDLRYHGLVHCAGHPEVHMFSLILPPGVEPARPRGEEEAKSSPWIRVPLREVLAHNSLPGLAALIAAVRS